MISHISKMLVLNYSGGGRLLLSAKLPSLLADEPEALRGETARFYRLVWDEYERLARELICDERFSSSGLTLKVDFLDRIYASGKKAKLPRKILKRGGDRNKGGRALRFKRVAKAELRDISERSFDCGTEAELQDTRTSKTGKRELLEIERRLVATACGKRVFYKSVRDIFDISCGRLIY